MQKRSDFMAQVNIRIEDGLKEKAEALFDDLGLNMSTAFNIFIKTVIRHKGIPFHLTLDPHYRGISAPAPPDTESYKAVTQKRRLGFLKDKVPALPDSFFEPLPEEDLSAWATPL